MSLFGKSDDEYREDYEAFVAGEQTKYDKAQKENRDLKRSMKLIQEEHAFELKELRDSTDLQVERLRHKNEKEIENMRREVAKAELGRDELAEDRGEDRERITAYWELRTAKLEDKLKAYEEKKFDHTANLGTSIDLEERERQVEARLKVAHRLEEKNNEMERRLEEAETNGFDKGHAIGYGVGVKEALSVSAEDRQSLAQVAALAASSHSNDANKEIAKAVSETMQKNIDKMIAGAHNKRAKKAQEVED